MRRILVGALAALLAAGPAWSSGTQNDGGEPGDASDQCRKLNRLLEVGETAQGQLDPPGDQVDHYGLDVTEDHVGHTINVTVDDPALRVDVHIPDCKGSVLGRGSGHSQGSGHGHTCADHGHTAECEPASSGPGYVSFVAEGPGVYIIEVRSAPQANQDGAGPGGKRTDPDKAGTSGCHEGCEGLLGYLVSSADEDLALIAE